MPAQFEVRETSNSISIEVRQSYNYLVSIGFGVIAGLTVGGLTAQFLRVPWLIAVSIVTGILSFTWKNRPKKVQLMATSDHFLNRGYFEGRGFFLERKVSTQDIRWLEHREEIAGTGIYDPPGMYAVLVKGTCCLLPYLGDQQTSEVIARIERKFPALAERWRLESRYTEHYTVLGL